MRYYIADLHLCHSNVNDKLDKRGFENVEKMNEFIIKQWNSKVKKDDEVVILGDFCWKNGETANELLKKLNGIKMLVCGNHDKNFLKDNRFDKSLFKWIKERAEFSDNGRRVVCSHYPEIFYNGQYRGAYMLYGHIHDTQDAKLLEKLLKIAKEYTYIDKSGDKRHIPFNMINCFCVYSNYVPLSLDEWIALQND